jgi:histone deacetylase 1/2
MPFQIYRHSPSFIYPHTNEQNDMVERRHRYIVEIGLVLLNQCKAPLKLWHCAFETFVYLINCMPTSVLNYKSPFECLFRSIPKYSFLLTFECLCFPFLVSFFVTTPPT